MACRLVPRDEQRHVERDQLARRERPTLDLRADEQRDDVVARVCGLVAARAVRGRRRAPSRPGALPRGAQPARRMRRSSHRTSGGIRRGSTSGTPSRSQITSTGRGAASASTRSTTSPAGTASSSSRTNAADLALHPAHRPAGELAVQDAPPAGVLGRVHVQDRSGDGPALAKRVVHERATPGAERLGVAADRADVVVPGDRLGAGFVLEHRRIGPQPREDLVVVRLQEEARRSRVDVRARRPRSSRAAGRDAVGQEIQERVVGKRQHRRPTRAAPPDARGGS